MFTYPQKILFKYCDPAGIVFFPRYFEMINDCTEAFFDNIGFAYEDLLQTAGVPTAQISAQFKAPSRHGDHLVLTLEAARVGGSSLDLKLTATSQEEIRFVANSTLVYVNQAGRPVHWPDDMRAALNLHINQT